MHFNTSPWMAPTPDDLDRFADAQVSRKQAGVYAVTVNGRTIWLTHLLQFCPVKGRQLVYWELRDPADPAQVISRSMSLRAATKLAVRFAHRPEGA